jgi:hypothetical protein
VFSLHVNQVAGKKYKIIPDRESIWMEYQKTFKDLCEKLKRKGKFETNYYDMLDHTIIHEVVSPFVLKRVYSADV